MQQQHGHQHWRPPALSASNDIFAFINVPITCAHTQHEYSFISCLPCCNTTTLQDFAGATCRFGDVSSVESIRAVAFQEHVDVVVSCLASRTGGKKDSWAIDYQVISASFCRWLFCAWPKLHAGSGLKWSTTMRGGGPLLVCMRGPGHLSRAGTHTHARTLIQEHARSTKHTHTNTHTHNAQTSTHTHPSTHNTHTHTHGTHVHRRQRTCSMWRARRARHTLCC